MPQFSCPHPGQSPFWLNSDCCKNALDSWISCIGRTLEEDCNIESIEVRWLRQTENLLFSILRSSTLHPFRQDFKLLSLIDQSSPCYKEAQLCWLFFLSIENASRVNESMICVLCCRMKTKSVLQVIGLLQGKCAHFRKPSVGLETTIPAWESVFRKICYYNSLCLEDSWVYLILFIFSKCKYNLSACISLFFFLLPVLFWNLAFLRDHIEGQISWQFLWFKDWNILWQLLQENQPSWLKSHAFKRSVMLTAQLLCGWLWPLKNLVLISD